MIERKFSNPASPSLAGKNAIRAVNFSMAIAYYEIGKRIIEYEQHSNKRAAYGESVLKELSKKLTADFGKGFIVANIEYFRKFYIVFSNSPKSDAVRRVSGY